MIDHKLAAIDAETFARFESDASFLNLAKSYLDLRRLVKEYFDAMGLLMEAIQKNSPETEK